MSENDITAWNPLTKGEFLIGTVTEVTRQKMITSCGIKDYVQLILTVEAGQHDGRKVRPGTMAVKCIGTSLDRQVSLVRPHVGERIAVEYRGRDAARATKLFVMNRFEYATAAA